MPRRLTRAFNGEGVPLWKRGAFALVGLALATAVWLPCVHLVFTRPVEEYVDDEGVAPRARALAAWQLEQWSDPARREAELAKMRGSNAEWDFMGRTFLVLALANTACRQPEEQARYLDIIDAIIDETLRLEKNQGMYHFLMDYARARPYIARPARSLFIDSEIALMLGVRRLAAEKPAYREPLRRRIELILDYMGRGPTPAAESYPDECWTFDNVNALAAVRIADLLDGTDHADFIRRWLEYARANLVHPQTGLLVSSFHYSGHHRDGPEGSTLWSVAHVLQVLDPEFARDQYDRAKKELGRQTLGFAWAREWPPSWTGATDIDSGPIVPVVGASAGSSGQALVGARAFGDRPFLADLTTSLEFAAFPVERHGRLKYAASNQVGDAVLLYAMVQGPVWDKVREGRAR
jgi:hypothetical protein